jgi:hypothetical protein
MIYCCKKFAEHANLKTVDRYSSGKFVFDEIFEEWSIRKPFSGEQDVMKDIKFCPFCGKKLEKPNL